MSNTKTQKIKKDLTKAIDSDVYNRVVHLIEMCDNSEVDISTRNYNRLLSIIQTLNIIKRDAKKYGC